MRAKLILPFLILYLFCHLLSVQGHEVDIVNAGSNFRRSMVLVR